MARFALEGGVEGEAVICSDLSFCGWGKKCMDSDSEFFAASNNFEIPLRLPNTLHTHRGVKSSRKDTQYVET